MECITGGQLQLDNGIRTLGFWKSWNEIHYKDTRAIPKMDVTRIKIANIIRRLNHICKRETNCNKLRAREGQGYSYKGTTTNKIIIVLSISIYWSCSVY